jgi:membrane protein DedA with SNARE-associated domain
MKAAKTVANILSAIVVMPIWFYLLYKMMVATNATELMWFLFWVYVPVGVLARIIFTIVERSEKTKTEG